ncbi:ATPase family AAA domain-containing protein 5 [Triplophysa rosa]|uniref:ATPase family AAA domain-containing protein 5 n=1 Tax=Triplophysa rosa TaxID=992332 RepID=A0A9W7TUT8_TRIRA|nr:ATPase family AAA domain-containing protein 5 [Triplophysa rosa]XP_057201688.1 ATPase family AAA domain-containing protein 5 [Triplophysa rosa]XP_057201689.1 ATPase family AAA domain-containing protein 5 [Triplophysa rosa]KAI7803414.1 putative ATPase family AAA domain-containing protein 5 [Triplophysa rosa]
MTGAVAMAAVMEDFESQPCKELRKDAVAPPVKTIASYFAPKPVEKPFSPPRTNNIMDYFKRTSPAQEIKSCSQVAKENSLQPSEQVGGHGIPGKPLRSKGLKRTRRTKEMKKSKDEDEKVAATDDVILIDDRKDSAIKESTKGCDASALQDKTGHDVSSDKESGIRKIPAKTDPNATKDSVESSEQKYLLNQNRKKDCGNPAPEALEEEKGKNKKSGLRRNRKAKSGCEEAKHCAGSVQDSDQPICDAKPEGCADKISTHSTSTVTISFEDFVFNESQKQVEGNAVSSSDCVVPEASAIINLCNDKITEEQQDEVVPLQVSPRTLTVQAEVHSISPKHELVKVAKDLKVARIFSRNRKSQAKEDKTLAILNPEVKQDVVPDRKKKSNVVLLEEDLVLDVLESSPNPKSTEAERKQFMNAFKQPSLDGFKSKPNKGQSKQNQAQETVPEAVEKEQEDTSLENKPVTSSEQNEEQKNCSGEKNKRLRKAGKKRPAKMDKEVPVETDKPKELIKEMEDEKESSPADDESNKQTVRELRRSTRDLSHKQSAAELNTNSTSRNRRQTSKVKDDVTHTPSLVSTPKVQRHKKGIYRAEMLCPPDMKGSPIRMIITRVFPSSATKAGDFEISSPLSSRELNAYKKRKQAKKLVEKAKALQQSKKDTTKKETLRRSTRSVNYCENEDSVVFLDESKSTPVTTQESGKSQKLRSLNEVLGKGTSQSKACKTPTGGKPAPLCIEKKAQRLSTVISIFDDSSQEASEASQDDEQFRAKIEFLKSGLPESFKKQIAKTAASRETYSQACASFLTVVHVQQRAADCSIWNLQWPTNPFLVCLKESYDLPSIPLMSVERSLSYTTVPAKKTFDQRVSFCWKEMPESVRQQLLEEIKFSNPPFPHQRLFMRFVKRREDYKLQASALDPVGQAKPFCPSESSNGIGRKRKRVDEGEGTGKVGKKTKSSHTDEEHIFIDSPDSSASRASPDVTEPLLSRRSRRGRLQRQKQNKEAKPAKVTSPVRNQSVSPGAVGTEDAVKEDVLWTEKYQPQHSCDVIGNMESVRKLHSWLKEWKLRADREEKRKQQDDDANESWLMGEGLEEMEDLLCNTLLITGPTGVGKTAAVYACAQELGFKVFEVNSSSQRSGRQILSQLKEATQSHQVDIQGVNSQKPSYFSNYSSTSINTKPGASPRKVNSPRRVVSSPRKPPQSPQSNPLRRGGLAPTSLASFFKAGARPASKEANNQDKKAQTGLKTCPKKETVKKGTEGSCPTPASTKISAEDQGKRAATSLILFEEVDIIFDEDTGFLAAIKTFNATTKRPVILTTSDLTFGATFDGYFEEIHFKAPSVADVSSYLQLLCLAENMRTDVRDVSSLLDWNRCDIRQSLLHLQFWACSGGGKQIQKPLPTSDVICNVQSDSHQSVKSEDLCGDGLPPCHSACTESLLGIWNLETENVEELLLKNESSVLESIKCWDLLSEVHRRGVNLLYSNMESLLPLPTHPLLPSTIRSQPAPNTQPQPEHLPQTVRPDVLEERSDDCSPLKVSSRMKGRKKLGMGNKGVFHSDSDSDDFLSLSKPSRAFVQKTKKKQADQSLSHVSEGVPVKQRRAVLSEAERKKSEPVLQCLGSLAEYMDHMSFLDSSLHCQPLQTEGSCRPQDFCWTGAEVKSGMTDDVRLECGSQVNGVSGEEIHAVLGHLSFRRCRAAVSKAWDKAQKLEEDIRREAEVELSLPVAPHRQSFSLAQTTPCEARVMERRSEVMRSVLSSRSAGVLGNRTAVSLDYMPSLRAICKSERLKEQGKIKRRFLHYLDSIHFTLPKSTMECLASEFP